MDQDEDKSDRPANRRLNQYWYSESTLQAIRSVVLAHSRGSKAAFVSAPTAFFDLLDNVAELEAADVTCLLLEYDRKFHSATDAYVSGEFQFFDYTAEIEDSVHDGSCSLILCDPPYLSDDCWKSFISKAANLATANAHFLFVSIPENLEMLQEQLNDAIQGREDLVLRETEFIPIQHGISHRFRFFTTIPVCNELDRQNIADQSLVETKEQIAQAVHKDNSDDNDIDDLFSILQGACISTLKDKDKD